MPPSISKGPKNGLKESGSSVKYRTLSPQPTTPTTQSKRKTNKMEEEHNNITYIPPPQKEYEEVPKSTTEERISSDVTKDQSVEDS
jgi:hypothetical protein